MEAEKVAVTFNGLYRDREGREYEGRIVFDAVREVTARRPCATCGAPTQDDTSSFTVEGVTIGKEFHWEEKQRQTFRGELELVKRAGKVLVINRLPLEWYLESVISSEMSPEAPLEFLKAHAVISRSWAMRILTRQGNCVGAPHVAHGQQGDELSEGLVWYDNEGHEGFDVCADDHCQRYQGIGRVNEAAVRAVRETAGEVLTWDGEICDARFSKCCGGRMELFSTCWQDRDYPYLRADADPFCGRAYNEVKRSTKLNEGALSTFSFQHSALTQRILNRWDRGTEFYRWRVEYTDEELGEIVKEKLGEDLGRIRALEALDRGPSGRIWRLRIVGEKGERIVGKELEIRRVLSRSHLYSSAFSVTTRRFFNESDEKNETDEKSLRFVLEGKGWGHGVGLCQIGAAEMAAEGYGYRAILAHYYPGAKLERR